MPAYFETGFSVRTPMWHGQGTVLDDYPIDWDDARKKAGLDWEPGYADLYVQQVVPYLCRECGEVERHAEGCSRKPVLAGRDVLPADVGPEGSVPVRRLHPIPADLDGYTPGDQYLVHVPAEGHQAIVRDDTWAVLATPTDSYKLIMHEQMGELLDAYTESWRKAGAQVKFETAGSIRGGRMVWALVYLDEPYRISGDMSETLPFAALLNAHDGTAACKLLPTQVRVVCWNTFNAASMEGDRTGHQVVIRHSGKVADRVEEAKQSLATIRDEAKAWQMLAEDLVSININDAVITAFLDEFIPIPENASERTRSARADRQATFRRMLVDSPTLADLAPTGYKLVQAAGEYLDHVRPFRSNDTYMARTMLTTEPVKAGTVKLVRTLARELA